MFSASPAPLRIKDARMRLYDIRQGYIKQRPVKKLGGKNTTASFIGENVHKDIDAAVKKLCGAACSRPATSVDYGTRLLRCVASMNRQQVPHHNIDTSAYEQFLVILADEFEKNLKAYKEKYHSTPKHIGTFISYTAINGAGLESLLKTFPDISSETSSFAIVQHPADTADFLKTLSHKASPPKTKDVPPPLPNDDLDFAEKHLEEIRKRYHAWLASKPADDTSLPDRICISKVDRRNFERTAKYLSEKDALYGISIETIYPLTLRMEKMRLFTEAQNREKRPLPPPTDTMKALIKQLLLNSHAMCFPTDKVASFTLYNGATAHELITKYAPLGKDTIVGIALHDRTKTNPESALAARMNRFLAHKPNMPVFSQARQPLKTAIS